MARIQISTHWNDCAMMQSCCGNRAVESNFTRKVVTVLQQWRLIACPLCIECAAGRVMAFPLLGDRLVGLVVNASASRAVDPGFESRLRRDFFGVELYQ